MLRCSLGRNANAGPVRPGLRRPVLPACVPELRLDGLVNGFGVEGTPNKGARGDVIESHIEPHPLVVGKIIGVDELFNGEVIRSRL